MALVAIVATAVGTPSWAFWTASGSSSGTAATGTLSAPTGVTTPAAAAPDVPVSWTAGAGGVPPDGYYVVRRTGSTDSPACASSPTALITTTSCTDSAVPDGAFSYVVIAVYRSWTAGSSASTTVTVRNATAVAFVVQPTDTVVNATVTPAVTVALRTADGQPFPSPGVPVTLAIDPNPGGGVLAGTTTVNTDAAGVATFDNLSVGSVGIGDTLTATSPGLTADISMPFAVLTPPVLGAARSFSILAFTAVVNTGSSTTVSGDVGVSPGSSVTGFPDGSIGGDIHAADAGADDAQSALVTAYDDLSSRPKDREIAGELGGLTFPPGVYHSTAALALTTGVTLDAGGDPTAVFVFQTDAAFNTAAVSTVDLINGAQAANVYWVVAGAAGTGAGTSLAGNLLALGAITLGDGTTLIGRALSRGTVTLAGSTIRFTDALPPTITIDGGAAATTKDTTPTVSGTSNAAQSSAVTVRVAGQTLSTTVGSGGVWSVTATALTAGARQVVATVRDAAGNGSAAYQQLTVEVNPDPVDLGSAGSYAVLARTAITSTGSTVVNGDVGVSPGLVGLILPPGTVNGAVHISDSAAAAAQADLLAAITEVSARPPHTEIVQDLAGQTFHIGIHHSTAALALTGNVTLDAEGDPNAIFIFTTDAAFNTAAGSTVTLANGAQGANVYWVVAGAAGTGASTLLAGSILASGAITLGAGTVLTGRALSRGAVTLAGNQVNTPGFPPTAARRAPSTTGPTTPPTTVTSPFTSPPATPATPTPSTTATTATWAETSPPSSTGISPSSTTGGTPPATTATAPVNSGLFTTAVGSAPSTDPGSTGTTTSSGTSTGTTTCPAATSTAAVTASSTATSAGSVMSAGTVTSTSCAGESPTTFATADPRSSGAPELPLGPASSATTQSPAPAATATTSTEPTPLAGGGTAP